MVLLFLKPLSPGQDIALFIRLISWFGQRDPNRLKKGPHGLLSSDPAGDFSLQEPALKHSGQSFGQ